MFSHPLSAHVFCHKGQHIPYFWCCCWYYQLQIKVRMGGLCGMVCVCARARACVSVCVCVCELGHWLSRNYASGACCRDRLVEWMLVVGPDIVQSVSCAYVIVYSACLSEKYGAHEHAFTCSFRRAHYGIIETSSF